MSRPDAAYQHLISPNAVVKVVLPRRSQGHACTPAAPAGQEIDSFGRGSCNSDLDLPRGSMRLAPRTPIPGEYQMKDSNTNPPGGWAPSAEVEWVANCPDL